MARSDDGNFSQFASIKTHFREMWDVKQEDKSQTIICRHFAIKSKNQGIRVSDYEYLNKSWTIGFLSVGSQLMWSIRI